MIENAAHALSFRRRRNHIIRFLLRRNDKKWGMTKMYNVFHTFHGMSYRAQYRVRDRSGILLWSDSGTKDTADSPFAAANTPKIMS